MPVAGPGLPAPFPGPLLQVRPEWIDENGHVNLAYYVVLFDFATDHLWKAIGLGDAFRATGHGTFAVETHTLYRGELLSGETVQTTSIILGLDAKRLHVAHEMRRTRDDAVAALQELMFLAVDLTTRRSVPFPPPFAESLQEAARTHARLPRPGWTGRRLAIPPPA